MRQAASTPVRTEDVYVLQNVDEDALRPRSRSTRQNYHKPSPGRRRREERNSARGPRPRPAPRLAERAASQRRWGEDERDRAARRRKLAPAPAPAPARRHGRADRRAGPRVSTSGGEVDGAAPNASITDQPACYTKRRRPPAGRASNETPVPRGLVATQLADFLSRQLPDETSARLTVAGARQPSCH